MKIGWWPPVLTLVAVFLATMAILDHIGATRKATSCGAADALRQHGLVNDAMATYISILKARPDTDNRCATVGVDRTTKEQCTRAERIAETDPAEAHKLLLATAEADPLLAPSSCVWTHLNMPSPQPTISPPTLGLFALDEFAADKTFSFPIGGGEATTYVLKFVGHFRQDGVHTVDLSRARTVTTPPHRQVRVEVTVTSHTALAALHRGIPILVVVDVRGVSEKGTSLATYSLCLVRRSGGLDRGHRSTNNQSVSGLFPGHLSGKAPIC